RRLCEQEAQAQVDRPLGGPFPRHCPGSTAVFVSNWMTCHLLVHHLIILSCPPLRPPAATPSAPCSAGPIANGGAPQTSACSPSTSPRRPGCPCCASPGRRRRRGRRISRPPCLSTAPRWCVCSTISSKPG